MSAVSQDFISFETYGRRFIEYTLQARLDWKKFTIIKPTVLKENSYVCVCWIDLN